SRAPHAQLLRRPPLERKAFVIREVGWRAATLSVDVRTADADAPASPAPRPRLSFTGADLQHRARVTGTCIAVCGLACGAASVLRSRLAGMVAAAEAL